MKTALKLRTYLIGSFSLLTFAIIASAIALFSHYVDQRGHGVLAMYGETLARDLAYVAADHLIVQEYSQLADLINEYSQRPDLDRITIIGTDGLILGDSDRELLGKDYHLVYPDFKPSKILKTVFNDKRGKMNVSVPIEVFDRLYGYVSVDILLESHYRSQKQLKQNGVLGGLFFLLVSLFCVVAISRKMTRPVSQMLLSANRIADGDFSQPVAVSGSQEIQKFAVAFNKMAEVIEQREARFRNILDAIPDAVFLADRQMKVLWANKKVREINEEAIGTPCYTVFWGRTEPCDNCPCREVLESGKAIDSFCCEDLAGDASPRYLEISAVPLFGSNEEVIGFVEIARDVSARHRAEEEKILLKEQLVQAQKMESIGRLASGVAHDFNNILSAVNGYAQLCLSRMGSDNPFREEIEIIMESGYRATRLTQQLLAFSRKQIINPKPLNINKTIDDTRKMLGRLLGEDVEIEIITEEQLWQVMADRSQLEQVILNLTVNARDAMPKGGKITVKTANHSFAETYVKGQCSIAGGDYVMLAISDSGQGMSGEVLAHIFEPFFTTKGEGKGTGLGLAMVYGIVKQNGGEIMVFSDPDNGSIFEIYLPRWLEDTEGVEKTGISEKDIAVTRGTETVLLVEDDDLVRRICLDILSDLGYIMLSAASGEGAMRIASRFNDKIDLLITDVVMPKMNGTEVAEMLLAVRPETKVLFMSGHTEDTIFRHGVLIDGVNFVQKPIDIQSLAQAVRKALG